MQALEYDQGYIWNHMERQLYTEDFQSQRLQTFKVIWFKDLLIDIGGDIGAQKRPSPESVGRVSQESSITVLENSLPSTPVDMLPENSRTSPHGTPPQPIESELAKIKKMSAVSFREHLLKKFSLDPDDLDWIIIQKITGASFLVIPHSVFEKNLTAAGPMYILKDYQDQLLNQGATKSTVSQLSPFYSPPPKSTLPQLSSFYSPPPTNAAFINGYDQWEAWTQKMATNAQKKVEEEAKKKAQKETKTRPIRIEESSVDKGKGKKYRYLFRFEFRNLLVLGVFKGFGTGILSILTSAYS